MTARGALLAGSDAMVATASLGCGEDATCRGVVAIGAAMQKAALLKADGSIWTWHPGADDPTRVFSAPDATGFENAQMCLRMSDRYVWCDPSYLAVNSRVRELPSLAHLSSWWDAPAESDCAVLQDGSLTCTFSTEPTFAERAVGIRNVAVGAWHFCAIATDGALVCQPAGPGAGDWSSAGAGLTDVVEVVSYAKPPDSTVRTASGELWSLHQVGVGAEFPVERTQITGIDGAIQQLVGGFDFACALVSEGDVYCWVVGDGTSGDVILQVKSLARRVPQKIASLPQPATALAAGQSSVCALLRDTTVWCWGIVGGDGKSGRPGGGYVEACD